LPALAVAYDSGAIAPPWVEPSISGVVFNDLDGDGEWDWGEPGLEGWQVNLCVLDVCQSSTTSAGGDYHFDNVRGKYGVGMRVPFGWQRVERTSASGWVSVGEGEHKGVDIAVRLIGEEVSGFSGSVWRDGQPASEGARIEALVGEKVCGETTAYGLRESHYSMWVLSASERGDCGEEGAEVRFRVGGAMANETVQWRLQHPTHLHEGREVDTLTETLDLIVGPELAIFEGAALEYRPDNPCHCAPEGAAVRAYVEDRLCGESVVFPVHPGPSSYQIVVLPDALRAGCGRVGASVRFTIGDEPANEGAVWEPGVHRVELSVGEPPTPSPTSRP
ncbi:MAG TPA: SdrD B-like domain-containing protein, partial [Dehalococcoidia bacterium]|nr:SdrD B-like domain-containing protein [Dehalococcoidia bacterium]